MRTKLTPDLKYKKLLQKVSNKEIIDQMIKSYLSNTKSAVENILTMCETVKDVANKLKNQEIDSNDVEYFCITVGLESFESSQFRKYRCIADHAENFRKYLDRLPSAYTILYEITTLDADKFEKLMTDVHIKGRVTIKDVRRLKTKSLITTKKTAVNSSNVAINITFDSTKLSAKSILILRQILEKLEKVEDIKTSCTDKKVLQEQFVRIAA